MGLDVYQIKVKQVIVEEDAECRQGRGGGGARGCEADWRTRENFWQGRGHREHYEEFEFDGNHYDLEDPVLLAPEDQDKKPYVANLKDIVQTKDGNMMVTGQWFYCSEEGEKK
ncbi:hypothetical protein SAY87_020993 [Trapa incisa]|uniref:BAH domain-containing protein n=1 Tax=Trapa incisa TaxID=236973 RepID=A0AAN7PV64_9MYRT|nr:hypothetical protein SAY87_020993 [Trapa incisa]